MLAVATYGAALTLPFITTGNNSSNEVRFVAADDPTAPLTLMKAREADVQYEADAAHGTLWILTNDEHVNFRVATAKPDKPAEWETLIAGSDRDPTARAQGLPDSEPVSEEADAEPAMAAE